ncbi:MAG TPA: phosphodiester glycosidase family protein [Anaerolineales bacterium]
MHKLKPFPLIRLGWTLLLIGLLAGPQAAALAVGPTPAAPAGPALMIPKPTAAADPATPTPTASPTAAAAATGDASPAATPLPVAPAPASGAAAPDGFRPVLAGTGVQLFRRDYPNGSPDFVQVIDLGLGAAIKPLYGQVAASRVGAGPYGGDDPRLTRQSLAQFWQEANQSGSAFCVTNGQFFYAPEDPTRLPFALKVGGKIVSDGFDQKDFQGQRLMLELWDGRADIVPLSQATLYGSDAPDIVGGLAEDAPKSIKKSVGRTFVGVSDRDGDGQTEAVLILNTSTATQAEAAKTLREWGAAKVMMLDGGGSAQLSCQGKSYVYSDRPIPQALAVLAGSLPAASLISQPSWPVLVAGERLPIQIEVQNSGATAWKAGRTHLVVQKSPWGSDESIPLSQDARPGESVVFTWMTEPITQTGVFTATWRLTSGSQDFQGQPSRFGVIVIADQLKNRRSDLEGRVSKWNNQNPEQVAQQARNWIKDQPRISLLDFSVPIVDTLKIDLQDVIWIPLAMAPWVLVLVFAVYRVQRRPE